MFLVTFLAVLILFGTRSSASPLEVHRKIHISKDREIDGMRMLKARNRDLGIHSRDETAAFIPRSSLEMDYADGKV